MEELSPNTIQQALKKERERKREKFLRTLSLSWVTMRKVEKESTRTVSSPNIPINQELEKLRKRAYLEAMEEADCSSSQFLIKRTCSRKTSPGRRSVSEEKTTTRLR